MDDKYYLSEQQTLFISDDEVKREENGLFPCAFTINYPRSLFLNKRMEASLVKLHCPSKLTAKNYEIFELKLQMKFFDLPQNMIAPNQSANWDGIKTKTIDYSFPYLNYNREEFKKILFKINKKMVIEPKKFWNQRYPYPNKVPENIKAIVTNPIFEDFSNPLTEESVEVEIYDIRLLSNVSTDTMVTYYSSTPSSFALINECYRTGGKYYRKSLHLAAYITYNELLHDAMGLKKEHYPIMKYEPNGYIIQKDDYWKTKLTVGDKSYIKIQRHNNDWPIKFIYTPHFYDPTLIHIYCDIIVESPVGTQKTNILQDFLIEAESTNKMQTINFRNLIYIPLRVEDVTSISLEFRDHKGELCFYKDGFISAAINLRPIEHI